MKRKTKYHETYCHLHWGSDAPEKKLEILEVVPLVVEIHKVGSDFIV